MLVISEPRDITSGLDGKTYDWVSVGSKWRGRGGGVGARLDLEQEVSGLGDSELAAVECSKDSIIEQFFSSEGNGENIFCGTGVAVFFSLV